MKKNQCLDTDCKVLQKEVLLMPVFITVSRHPPCSSRCQMAYPRHQSFRSRGSEIHPFPLLRNKESQLYPARFSWRDCFRQLPLPSTMSKAPTELQVSPNNTQVGKQILCSEPGMAELHTVWCQRRSIKLKLGSWCCHMGCSPKFHYSVQTKIMPDALK